MLGKRTAERIDAAVRVPVQIARHPLDRGEGCRERRETAPPRAAGPARRERDRRLNDGRDRRSRSGAAALLLLPEEKRTAGRRERTRSNAARALVGNGALRLLLRGALADLHDEPADDRIP